MDNWTHAYSEECMEGKREHVTVNFHNFVTPLQSWSSLEALET